MAGLNRGQQGGEIVEVLGVGLELLEGAHDFADLGGEPAAQADDLVRNGRWGLVGWGMARPPAVDQGGPAALAIAADPEAGSLAVAAEGPGGQRESAVREVVLDQTLAVGLRGHLTPPRMRGH